MDKILNRNLIAEALHKPSFFVVHISRWEHAHVEVTGEKEFGIVTNRYNRTFVQALILIKLSGFGKFRGGNHQNLGVFKLSDAVSKLSGKIHAMTTIGPEINENGTLVFFEIFLGKRCAVIDFIDGKHR